MDNFDRFDIAFQRTTDRAARALAVPVNAALRRIEDHAAAVLVPYLNGDHDAAAAVLGRRPVLSAICLRLGLFDAIR